MGYDKNNEPVYLKDIWPSSKEISAAIAKAVIERPRTIEPPWVFPAELASVLLAGPADRAARMWHHRFFANSNEDQP